MDQGITCGECDPPPPANYRVDFFSGQVNNFTSAPTEGGFSLSTVANFKLLLKGAELPTEGISIKIFKLTAGVPAPEPVKELTPKIFLNLYTAFVKKSDLQVNPTGTTDYRVELCLFGGRCIPDQGLLTLRKDDDD